MDVSKATTKSPYKIKPVFFWAFFLGPLGSHYFYLRRYKVGLLHLLTLGGLFIWTNIDIANILLGNFKDKDNRLIKDWQ